MTFTDVLDKFIAADITTTISNIPVEVPSTRTEGMPRNCVISCDNPQTVSKVHLVQKIPKLSSRRVSDLKRVIGYAMAREELISPGAR
jgi:mRNA-degrading endonuclease toxin of MazEF toxin-antitoxin module